MICVQVTTSSGHSWKTSISGTIEGAKSYFIGRILNVGGLEWDHELNREIETESMERVLSVELVENGGAA